MRARLYTLIAFTTSFVDCRNVSIFDLEADPYETTNIYDDPSISKIQRELEEMMYYFVNNVSTTISVAVDQSMSIYSTAGGVVPFLGNYSNHPSIPTILSTPRTSVPSIVFILMDDVGWNDVSFHEENSTWLNFATPNMDSLAFKGIRLEKYYTGFGYGEMPEANVQLPLSEVTMAQELQLQGYHTVMIGKWHLGLERWEYTPRYRGFDNFYGYYSGSIGYESLLAAVGHFDVHDQEALVTNSSERSTHLTLLLQQKVEAAITKHATDYAPSGVPLFLYYAPQNVHLGANDGLQAPEKYTALCGTSYGNVTDDLFGYCALMIMIDEAIGRTLCSLEDSGLADNLLMVVSSDNGGLSKRFAGVNFPYRGGKGAYLEGSLHNAAIVYGSTNLIPIERQGSRFEGLVHVSDWLPTFLHLASKGNWTAPSNGFEIDGVNVYDSLANGSLSPRNVIFHNYDASRDRGAVLINSTKLIIGGLSRATETATGFYLNGTHPETCFIDAIPTGFPSPSPTNAHVLSSSTAELVNLHPTTSPFPDPSSMPTVKPSMHSAPSPTNAHTVSPTARLVNTHPTMSPSEHSVRVTALNPTTSPIRQNSVSFPTSEPNRNFISSDSRKRHRVDLISGSSFVLLTLLLVVTFTWT